MNPKSLILLAVGVCLPLFGLADSQFTVEKSDRAVTFKIDGELFTEYVLGGEGNKPYFWPVIGPDGKAMTRAFPMKDVPGEKQDHPHHRSFILATSLSTTRIPGMRKPPCWRKPREMRKSWRKA